MKVFNIEWSNFFDGLAPWSRLPLQARKVILDRGRPAPYLNAADFGEELFLLLKSRLLISLSNPAKVHVRSRYLPFLGTMRAMWKTPVFDSPTRVVLEKYVDEHFLPAERRALHAGTGSHPSDLVAEISSEAWLGEFLEKGGRRWEARYTVRNERPHLVSIPVLETARRIVRTFLEGDNGIRFDDFRERFEDVDIQALAAAVHACIRYCLIFPALSAQTLDPLIGVWPGIWERRRRQPPPKPAHVTPTRTFRSAFLMGDMTEILVAAAAQSLRLRSSDGKLFSKSHEELAGRLVSLPVWFTGLVGITTEERIPAALFALRGADFIERRGVEGRDLHLAPTAEGTAWLGLPGKDRLKALLDRFRAEFDQDRRGDSAWFPRRERIQTTRGWPDFQGALHRAFGGPEMQQWTDQNAFLAWHRELTNPLLEHHATHPDDRINIGWSYRNAGPEELESAWEDLLRSFIAMRLLPLGGVELGVTDEGATCLRMTDAGRYLLGLADDFEYGSADETHIIVQPNFEVVFMAPAPALEAEISRFARRTGRKLGVLFTVTKASIFGAAASGLGADQAIATLRKASSKDLPRNVEHEIRGWFAQCRRVSLRPAILIRCPDAETAARVISAGGKDIQPVSDTVLELTDPRKRNALVKKLRALGVFVRHEE